MEDLFLSILNRSIAAGWVVLAIMAVRLLLKKVPRNLICALWALVGFRLLFGDSIESRFSLLPSVQTIPPESVYDPSPVIASGFQAVDNAVNPIYTASLQTDGLSSVNPLQIWLFIGACIWVIGMAAMGLYTAVSCWLIHCKVRESVEAEPGIFRCDRIDTPFILGIVQPKIYLPSNLDDGTAAHVIAHEQTHLRRRDHWWKPLGFAFLAAFWFNPILWVGYILMCRDIELACDEAVIKSMSVPEKKAYSVALLECSVRRVHIAACPLAFGEVGVKERVKTVLNYKKPAFWLILIAMAACIILAVGFLTDPVSNDPMICFETLVYVQEGAKSQTLPSDAEEVGNLAGIQQDGDYPESELYGMNLDESFVGCPIYFKVADHGYRLYLQTPDGYYQTFVPTKEAVFETPHTLTSQLKPELVQWGQVTIWNHQDIHVTLTEDEIRELVGILNDIPKSDFVRGSSSGGMSVMLGNLGEHTAETRWSLQMQYSNGRTALVFASQVAPMYGQKEDAAGWVIENDALSAWMETYLALDGRYSSLSASAVQHVQAHSVYGTMSIGLPNGWEYQVEDGSIRFWPTEDSGGCVTLSSGNFGPDNGAAHESYIFNEGVVAVMNLPVSEEVLLEYRFQQPGGGIVASVTGTDSWWSAYCRDINSILGTLGWSAAEDTTLYTAEDFGITLSVENVSPVGLDLIVSQEGIPMEELITGRPFHLERLTDDGWKPLPYRSSEYTISWTMEALLLNLGGTSRLSCDWEWLYGELVPGRYRIVKSFSARFRDANTFFPEPEYRDATCYVEFTVGGERTFVYSNENIATPITLTLYADGTYDLFENLLSSYMNHGTATWIGDELYLTTYDKRFEYHFTFDGTNLIYNESGYTPIHYYYSDLKTYAVLPDGAEFHELMICGMEE